MKSDEKKNDTKQNELRDLARSATFAAKRNDELGTQLTRLRSELVEAKNQRNLLFEPTRWGSVKSHLRFNSKSSKMDRHIKDLESKIAELSAEYSTIGTQAAEAQKKLAVARQKSDQDRRSRCAAEADAAAQSAPSRKRFLDARNKLNNVKSRLREVELEIAKIENTPSAGNADAVADKAQEFLDGGDLEGVPVNNADPRYLELTRQEKTLRAACRIQEKELAAVQREYGREIAVNIKPKFSELARRIAPAVRELIEVTIEDQTLRIAASVEQGEADLHIPALRFPGIQPEFAEQKLDGYLNRLRLAGYEV
jgi:hypothetical protein